MAIAAPFPTASSPHMSAPRMSAPRMSAPRMSAPRITPPRRSAARRPVRSGPRRTWRLTRRGRIVLGVLVSVPFAAVLMVTGSLSADAGTDLAAQGSATAMVVVQPGESLWQIARQVAPNTDPRATLTTIRDLNGLGDDTVVPGQALVVPAQS